MGNLLKKENIVSSSFYEFDYTDFTPDNYKKNQFGNCWIMSNKKNNKAYLEIQFSYDSKKHFDKFQ